MFHFKSSNVNSRNSRIGNLSWNKLSYFIVIFDNFCINIRFTIKWQMVKCNPNNREKKSSHISLMRKRDVSFALNWIEKNRKMHCIVYWSHLSSTKTVKIYTHCHCTMQTIITRVYRRRRFVNTHSVYLLDDWIYENGLSLYTYTLLLFKLLIFSSLSLSLNFKNVFFIQLIGLFKILRIWGLGILIQSTDTKLFPTLNMLQFNWYKLCTCFLDPCILFRFEMRELRLRGLDECIKLWNLESVFEMLFTWNTWQIYRDHIRFVLKAQPWKSITKYRNRERAREREIVATYKMESCWRAESNSLAQFLKYTQ